MLESKKSINGLSVAALTETVAAIQNNSSIAAFNFRVRNEWKTGVHNQSHIQGFYGACSEDTSRDTPFIYDTDMPTVLNGNNKGANPLEFLLHSLLGCMTTTMVLLASAEGIAIESINSSVEGNIDLQGVLGLDECISKEYQKIQVTFDIKGKLSTEEKEHLLALTKSSPIYNTIANPVGIELLAA